MIIDAGIIANFLTFIGFVVGSVIFLARFRVDIQVILTRLDAIDKRLDEATKVRDRMQSDLESRFDGLEARLRAVEALAHVGAAKVVAAKRKAT